MITSVRIACLENMKIEFGILKRLEYEKLIVELFKGTLWRGFGLSTARGRSLCE